MGYNPRSGHGYGNNQRRSILLESLSRERLKGNSFRTFEVSFKQILKKIKKGFSPIESINMIKQRIKS